MSGESRGDTSLARVKLDGVNQVPALLGEKSVRDSVHIHRDLLQDSHVYRSAFLIIFVTAFRKFTLLNLQINYRKGNWKIIVGHHELPFIFPRVYEEPSKTGGWLYDGGSIRGRFLEMTLTLTDWVVGEENDLRNKS